MEILYEDVFCNFGIMLPALIDAAIEAEFKDLNLAQARKLGSEMLRKSRAPAGKAHLQVGFVGTDTDLLVEGITDGNNNKYVAFAKAGIKTIVDPWIEGLLVSNNRFLEADPTAALILGGSEKNRKKRDAFKLKLAEVIDNVALGGVAPSVDATFRNLKVTKTAVSAEIIRVVNAWIDSLPVSGGNLIVAAVKHDGLLGAPANQTPAAFKTAIENLIKTF
jgi:hypothetical protein